ncbi:hypothetical protein GCM10019059_35860 [Camelimonas fluminis]|uniref:Uncharacterized protein n=1 Tax=Camelimonas fluminis TaxID=1576911 RepID=A0ABV7UHM2_9HYPH|nr:hypothetical protein [Camelimonas fluminis]GHE73131.1 hypothetical protein GCM10019059_35860 [Camelimonas fluminis]
MAHRVDETRLLAILNDSNLTDLSPDQRKAALRCLMSGADQYLQTLDMPSGEYVVSLEHPRVGIVRIPVSPSALRGTIGSILDVAQSLIETAAEIAASGSIDPRSFDTTDDYEGALKRRVLGFQIISVCNTADLIRWDVSGHHEPNKPFMLSIDAHDREDAEFQARWTETLASTSAPLTVERLPQFMEAAYRLKIIAADPKPIELLELAATALDLVRTIRTSPESKSISALMDTDAFQALETLLARAARIPDTPSPVVNHDTPEAESTVPTEPQNHINVPCDRPLDTDPAPTDYGPDPSRSGITHNEDTAISPHAPEAPASPSPLEPTGIPTSLPTHAADAPRREPQTGELKEPINIF